MNRVRFSAIALIAAATLHGGCATNSWDVAQMESQGALRVEVPDVGQVYRVTVRNLVGIGFDGNAQADRLNLARLALQKQCPRLDLLDERAIERGTYGTGRPMIDYVARLQCGAA